MSSSDKRALKLLCYIVAMPLGVLTFKGVVLAVPYLGMLLFAMIIGSFLTYYFDL